MWGIGKGFLEEAVSVMCQGEEDLVQWSWEPGRHLGQRGWQEPAPGAANLRFPWSREECGLGEQNGAFLQGTPLKQFSGMNVIFLFPLQNIMPLRPGATPSLPFINLALSAGERLGTKPC